MGLNTEYTGSIQDGLLHIWDVIDNETVHEIFNKFGKPKYLVCDGMSENFAPDTDVQYYAIDAWLEWESKQDLNKQKLSLYNTNILHCANFQINKKQVNRYLAIKLCEVFGVDADYTWSGIGQSFDMSYVIDERKTLDDTLIDVKFSSLLEPIHQYKKKWIVFDDIDSAGTSSIENYGGNLGVWNNGLGKLMSQTAVSLITESVWTQRWASFSEKTAFAIFACTFPIWVGGYNMAKCWQDKGFDIFDDIIDHSYQNKNTLLERCFYAFELNKDILVDLEYAKQTRENAMDRLEKNRQIFFDGAIGKHNKKVVSSWPSEVTQAASYSIQKFLSPLECFN